jgi:hypothetical protein
MNLFSTSKAQLDIAVLDYFRTRWFMGYAESSKQSVTANIEIQLGSSTYLDEARRTAVEGTVDNFIRDYRQRYSVTEVYY